MDIKNLEAAVADRHMPGFFRGHRICHHSNDVCCRGFWNRHKDKFTLGQIAQRLGLVRFVQEDKGLWRGPGRSFKLGEK